MNTRYLTLLCSLAFLSVSVTAGAGKPNKPGGGNTKVQYEYSAELIAGDFVFASGMLVGLTSNRKGTSLPGEFRLEMVPESAFAWDYIFLSDCSALLPGGIAGFGVLAGSWSIEYTPSRVSPGNIHITMRNLDIYPGTSPSYSGVDFDFDLHGVMAADTSFLPANLGQTSTHTLTEYKLWAGAQGGFTCNSDGRPRLASESTLEIMRTR